MGSQPAVITQLLPLLFAILLSPLGCGSSGPTQVDDTSRTESGNDATSRDEVAQADSETENPYDGLLQIRFVDVGQGDGAVLVTPSGRVVLIDAGPSDAGDDMLEALREMGAERINLALTSHPHSDHIGGLRHIINAMEVMRYGDPGFPHTSQTYANLLTQLEDHGIPSFSFSRGNTIALDDDVQLTVLGPGSFLSGTRSDANSNSLVLLLEHGDVRILFTGDAEEDTEHDLMAAGVLVDVDLLKVAHHGGAYSTTFGFLEAVQPDNAVISCGAGNSYGHPAPATVERLESVVAGSVFRTDLLGDITVTSDGETLTFVDAIP